MLLILLLLASTLAVRVWLRSRYSQAIAYDVALYLFMARLIRRNGHRFLANRPSNFPYAYCSNQGLPWLLSFLPESALAEVERWSSPVFDSVAALLVYVAANWLEAVWPGGLPPHAPLLATVMYALNPGLLRIGSGPRAYTGTPRVFGELLFLAHAVLALVALYQGSLLCGLLSAGCGALLIVTAVFGNQVLVFFGLALAIWVSPSYLAILAGALGLSLVLFPTVAWPGLRGQVVHSVWYFRFYRHVFIGFGPRTLRHYAKSWREHGWPKLRAGTWRRFANWCLDESYPLHLLAVCYTPALFALFAPAWGEDALSYAFVRTWAAAALVCFLATKTRPLMFLGEGERYLEYGLFPLLMLALSALRGAPAGAWVLCVLTAALGVLCLTRAGAMLASMEENTLRHREAIAAMDELPPGPVLVFGYSAYQALLWGNKPLIGFRTEPEHAVMPEGDFRVLFANLPLPSADFPEVLRRFAPRYIYGQTWAFDRYVSLQADPEVFRSRTRLLYENGAVQVHEVQGWSPPSAA